MRRIQFELSIALPAKECGLSGGCNAFFTILKVVEKLNSKELAKRMILYDSFELCLFSSENKTVSSTFRW